MVTGVAAEQFRLAQVGIGSLVERDLASFWGSLDLARPELARDALLEFVPSLVQTYGEHAAVVAADWYDEQRALAGVPGRFRAVMFVPETGTVTERTVRRAAEALFSDNPGGTLWMINGKATKYALAGSRQTIITATEQDPRTAGWQRVTRPGACDFCKMLAGRGGVYKRTTVAFAAHGGARGGKCRCAAVPSWDQDAPEVPAEAYRESERAYRLPPEKLVAINSRSRRRAAGDVLQSHRDRTRKYLNATYGD